ncbi:Bon domain protein [Cyanobacterium sp. HL-69]|uniref:BON domain-containing protein n=1 Tax=Cyanobacterium sp. HL-69 TaxID=2054282 RepID=UPI000CA219FB|nr:Bon domain protein [Cyanobacterium sp. HL-69]
MSIRDNQEISRKIYREYTDTDGIVRTEYKDINGNIYTEYTDINGNFHSDRKELIDDRLVDAHIQDARVDKTVAHIDRADKNTSKGLLIGVIVTTIIALVAGVIYFLNDANNPEPVAIVPIPAETAEPESIEVEEQEAIQTTATRTTPEPSSPVTPESNNNPPTTTTTNNNITVTPSESNQNPAETNNQPPAANPTPTNTRPQSTANNPATPKSDGDLKNEIVKKFQDNLGDNQLNVEVNNGDVMISGMLETQAQVEQIQPILKSVEGVKTVNIMATIEPQRTN